MFVEIIRSFFYGVVQGVTEWLPISSTGHLILFEQFIQFDLGADFMRFFRIVVQLGSIMAVVVLFWKKIWPFCKSGSQGSTLIFQTDKLILWAKIFVSCLPAIVIGLFLNDWLDYHFYNFPTVAATLIIYGVLFIVVEKLKENGRITTKTEEISQLSFKIAFIIGVFQVLAMIPGTSRSGATILGAVLIGCSRKVAAEFSFFLAIPVMFGATLLSAVSLFSYITFDATVVSALVVGVLVSFFVSLFAIKFLLHYIKRNDFKIFGYYRIILGGVLLLYILV